MPTFMQVRDWIREAAIEMGATISVRKAKHFAGEYMLSLEGLAHSTITYADPTGEEACKRWFMAVSHG